MRAILVTAITLLLFSLPVYAQSADDVYFLTLLLKAKRMEKLLKEAKKNQAQRSIYRDASINAYSELYLLYNFRPAYKALKQLVNQGEARDEYYIDRYGYDPLGLYEVKSVIIPTKNPLLKAYTVFLINVYNRSYRPISGKRFNAFLYLDDGRILEMEHILPGHPLFENYEKGYKTFRMGREVFPGVSNASKALFKVAGLKETDVNRIVVLFEDQRIVIPYRLGGD